MISDRSLREALVPQPFQPGFLRHEPDHSRVIWNRGLTHAHLAELLQPKDKAAARFYVDSGIADFDRLRTEPAYHALVEDRGAIFDLNVGLAKLLRLNLGTPSQDNHDQAAAKDALLKVLQYQAPAEIHEKAREGLKQLRLVETPAERQ